MDEKTAELRDLFVDVTEAETVTESQAESRGSIPTDDEEIDDRIREVIHEIAAEYDLDTPLSTDDLVTVVRSFFAGRDDDEIASELDGSEEPADVTEARIHLHLVTDEDLEGSIDESELRDRLERGDSVEEIAAAIDVDTSAVRRRKQLLEVQEERRRIGDKYRQAFELALGDLAMSRRLTEGIAEDGLEEATEDIETDVSF